MAAAAATKKAKAAMAKKTAKAVAAKKTVTASSSPKRRRTPSPPPPLPDNAPEVSFDLGSFSPKRKRRTEEEEDSDGEMLVQRAAKRARASTGDKPSAGTLHMPLLVESSPDSSPQHRASTEQEDVDAVIEEIVKDAEAEAAKTAAEEAAKEPARETSEATAEDPGKAIAEGAGKAAADDANKAAAREADKAAVEEEAANDQPSSSAASTPGKYLKVGDDLFVHLLGTASTRATGWERLLPGKPPYCSQRGRLNC
nr:nucleolar and coiled-body phosphoprotein 1-like [Aegilops tauschii subsp. strangulata]